MTVFHAEYHPDLAKCLLLLLALLMSVDFDPSSNGLIIITSFKALQRFLLLGAPSSPFPGLYIFNETKRTKRKRERIGRPA